MLFWGRGDKRRHEVNKIVSSRVKCLKIKTKKTTTTKKTSRVIKVTLWVASGWSCLCEQVTHEHHRIASCSYGPKQPQERKSIFKVTVNHDN